MPPETNIRNITTTKCIIPIRNRTKVPACKTLSQITTLRDDTVSAGYLAPKRETT